MITRLRMIIIKEIKMIKRKKSKWYIIIILLIIDIFISGLMLAGNGIINNRIFNLIANKILY